MSDGGRIRRMLYERVLSDARRLLGLWPAERKPLSQLLRSSRPEVRLTGGGSHRMSEEELRDAASRIPWFMHELVKFPIVIVYRREAGRGVYRVDGDVWAARAVSVLLGGGYWEEKWSLSYEEVRELIGRYKTLFLVTIYIELGGLVDSDEP